MAREKSGLAPLAWVDGRGVFILGSGTLLFSRSPPSFKFHGASSTGEHVDHYRRVSQGMTRD